MILALLTLAQATPPGDAIKEWLLVFGFLIGIAVGVKKLFWPEKTPQPLKVAPADEFVPMGIYLEDVKENEKRHTGAKESRERMHKEIGEHSADIASLKATREHTNHTLASIDTKLTTILQRLPRQ